MTKMRRQIIVCVTVWALMAAGVYAVIERIFDGGGCTGTDLTQLASPDGAWAATVVELWCESPFVTGVDTEVRLDSALDRTRSAEILSVENGGHVETRPQIVWTAPNVLQITVRNFSILKVLTRQYGGVSIDLRFDPHDPAARAAWLRTHDMEPDSDLEREW